MLTAEIERCPYCNNSPCIKIFDYTYGGRYVIVKCEKCKTQTIKTPVKSKTIKRGNTIFTPYTIKNTIKATIEAIKKWNTKTGLEIIDIWEVYCNE